MPTIVEKRRFKIPPCRVDKDLIKEVGKIIDKQSPAIYDHLKSIVLKERSNLDYYKKYPKEIERDIESIIGSWRYEPSYLIVASSRNIESKNIDDLTEEELPTDTKSISLSIGRGESPMRIEVDLYMEKWRADDSSVSVSGYDSTWVHGTADQLEAVFKKYLLGYHRIVESSFLKVLLSLIMWTSVAFTITYLIFPILIPFLKAGVLWIHLFMLVLLLGGFSLYPLYTALVWLFPRFELKSVSLQRRLRKWIIGFLVSSGIIAEIVARIAEIVPRL